MCNVSLKNMLRVQFYEFCASLSVHFDSFSLPGARIFFSSGSSLGLKMYIFMHKWRMRCCRDPFLKIPSHCYEYAQTLVDFKRLWTWDGFHYSLVLISKASGYNLQHDYMLYRSKSPAKALKCSGVEAIILERTGVNFNSRILKVLGSYQQTQ